MDIWDYNAVKELSLLPRPCWSKVTNSTTTATSFISAPLQLENKVLGCYQCSLLYLDWLTDPTSAQPRRAGCQFFVLKQRLVSSKVGYFNIGICQNVTCGENSHHQQPQELECAVPVICKETTHLWRCFNVKEYV